MSTGVFTLPEPVNEPVREYAPGSPERSSLKATLDEMSGRQVEIPMVIGGEEVRTGRTADVVMPHDHQHVLGQYHQGGEAEVARAIAAAAEGRREWAAMSWEARAAVFLRAAELLTGPWRDTINAATMLGQSKTAFQAEIDAACELADFWRWNVSYMHRLMSEQPTSSRGMWNRIEYRPLEGFVFAVAPFNFTAIAGNLPTAPAMMGNTVIFKPASFTPMMAVRLVEILEEAGLPKGVLNLVLGSGSDLGDHIVKHPNVDLISFTGSSDTGAHISEIAGRLLKRVSAELGGKNAIIVLDDADVDLSLEGIVWSAFGTSGQRCTAASRVIAHRGIANDLIDKLVGRAKKMKMGHGLEASTDLGPVVSRAAQEKVASYMPIAEKEGATIAAGGRIPTEGALGKGFFHEPTVLVDVKPNMRVAQEEIFGPVTSVIEVSNIDEAIKVLNNTKYGLSSSVYTRNVNNAFRFMRDAETGIVYVNAGTIGAEIQLPFGGMKATGNGHREAGRAALDVYSEWKSIYVDYSGKLQRAQMDTDGQGKAP